MIICETVELNGSTFTRTYSDTYQIRKVGTEEIYSEAYDVQEFAYEETDIPLEVPESTEGDMREALSILGVNL